MDISSITHIFQVPMSWIRAVDRLLKTHAGNGINYNADAESGPQVELDTERLEEIVEDITAPQNPATKDTFTSGFTGASNAHTKVTGETFTAGGEKGLLIYIATRGTDDNYDGAVVFRPFTITRDGRIYQVGDEANMLGVRTDQS